VFECFALVGGNIDCGKILEPTREVVGQVWRMLS
jgi:hypothetical protein